MLAKINAGGFDTKCDLEIVYVNVAIMVRTVGGWIPAPFCEVALPAQPMSQIDGV